MLNSTISPVDRYSFSRRRFLCSATVAVVASAALLSSGCVLMGAVTPSAQKTIEISGTSSDVAFSKATRVVVELGYDIFNSDKSGGTFTASRIKAGGFVEASDMTFTMDKAEKGRLAVTMRFSGAVDNGKALSEFVEAYGKYVKVE